MPEMLARTLRHEVGDFLQKVYATVAILQTMLPKEKTEEHNLLATLRLRAEGCRDLMNAVQDFLCPVILACEPVDLARVAAQRSAAAQVRFPGIEILTEAAGAGVVNADPLRTAQIADIALNNACEAAASRVVFRTSAANDRVDWSVLDDGPGVRPELQDRLFEPFLSTRPAHAGLGLPLAQKLVLLHGGQIQAGGSPHGGFQLSIRFPRNGCSASE
jgi:signal transduction histidine kinase